MNLDFEKLRVDCLSKLPDIAVVFIKCGDYGDKANVCHLYRG